MDVRLKYPGDLKPFSLHEGDDLVRRIGFRAARLWVVVLHGVDDRGGLGPCIPDHMTGGEGRFVEEGFD